MKKVVALNALSNKQKTKKRFFYRLRQLMPFIIATLNNMYFLN